MESNAQWVEFCNEFEDCVFLSLQESVLKEKWEGKDKATYKL